MFARSFSLVFVMTSVGLGAACPADPGVGPLTKGFDADTHAEFFPIAEGDAHEVGKFVDGGPIDGPITCNGCHDGGETFKEFFCLNCHAPDQAALDRLRTNTHGLIDAFVADNTQCLFCHPDGRPGSQIGPPPPPPYDGGPGFDAGPPYDAGPVWDHNVSAFPYAPGTPHAGDFGNPYMLRANAQALSHCAACHASGEDRTLTRCNSCHAEDDPPTLSSHVGNPLQAAFNASTDCKECHWTTPLPPELSMDAHDILTCTTHYSATCFQCHIPDQRQGQPKEWAYDFTMPAAPVECAACHAGDPRQYPAGCP